MTFAEWIEGEDYRRAEEPVTRALQRLASDLEASYRTLFYAWKGARVGLELARKIDEKSGGKVAKESLVFLPTADEIIAREKAEKERERAERAAAGTDAA